jgi:hypothetical protein
VDRKAVSWEGVEWIHLAQDVVVAVSFEHSNEHLDSKKCTNFSTGGVLDPSGEIILILVSLV